MIRYYLADVVGDGTEENPFRPSVANYPVSWSAEAPSDENGIPLNSWSFVFVSQWATEDIAVMEQDPTIDPLPPVSMDTQISTVDMASFSAVLSRRGIGLDVLLRAETFGDLVANLVGRAANPL